MQVYDHTSPKYVKAWGRLGEDRFNGTYYYSREIVRNIIPNIKTDRKWFTVNCTTEPADHSIVFIHDNKFPAKTYSWLEQYNDVILVCGVPETMDKVAHLGTPIYLPLSIDVKEVEQYRQPKTRDCAYAGRWSKIQKNVTSYQYAHLCGLDRRTLLMEMAKYRKVYAVGRTAIEARALGCEIGAYDPRYPDPSIWEVHDNLEMVPVLQRAIDEIDNGERVYRPIGVDHPAYIRSRAKLKSGQHNGAYYYSKEIIDNIMPRVKTDRPWDSLGIKSAGTYDNAIVFIHHNIDMDKVYSWLKGYKNLVLVVSSPYTLDWAKKNGYKAIYLPLSIDTEYVSQFRTEKTKDTCFCGNIWAFRKEEIAETIPEGVDFQPKDICREELLKFMAPYKKVYAIGRCALEAKCLGAELLQCYKKFDVDHWKLLDNREAAEILQRELDKIDKK